MKGITQFFQACSGVQPSLLRRAPTESAKYTGIGATIFFTGIFAFLAASYALYTVTDNSFMALSGGLLWGSMIFNLDRYIVSSMKKKENFSSELKIAIPRLALAILIALVISKPLELKMFEKEIDSELVILQQEERKKQEEGVRSRFQNQQEEVKNEIDLLKNEISEKTTKRDELREIAREEADGTGGTGIKNAGPIYRIKKEHADQAEKELKELYANNNSVILEKTKWLDSIQQIIATEVSTFQHTTINGLAGRLEAMNSVTKKYNSVWLAHWFIILLFITIECLPVFVKLLAEKGPYDHLLHIHEHRFHTQHAWEIGNINEHIKRKSHGIGNPEKNWMIAEIIKPLGLTEDSNQRNTDAV